MSVSSVGCTKGPDSFFRLQDKRNRITVKAFLWRDAEHQPGQTGSEWTLGGDLTSRSIKLFWGQPVWDGAVRHPVNRPSIHLSHLWWCLMEYSLNVYLSWDYQWSVSLNITTKYILLRALLYIHFAKTRVLILQLNCPKSFKQIKCAYI